MEILKEIVTNGIAAWLDLLPQNPPFAVIILAIAIGTPTFAIFWTIQKLTGKR